MPRQARGFWTCDFCQESFATHDEAAMHESYECIVRRAQHEPLYQDPFGRSSRIPPPAASATGSTSRMFPATPGYRRYLVMPQDTGSLSTEDTTTCRNIELFEVDAQNTTDAMGTQLSSGTVGLRCIHCIGDPTAASGNAIFPRNVTEIGDCLRDIAEGHLWCCQRTPAPIRQQLKHAFAIRQQASRQPQGQAWFEQETSRRLLLDYCALLVRELGLMDRFPNNTGIIFSPPEIVPRQRQSMQGTASPSPAAQPIYAVGDTRQQQQHPQSTRKPAPQTSLVAAASSMPPIPDPSLREHMPFGVPQYPSALPKGEEIGTPEPLPLAPGFNTASNLPPATAGITATLPQEQPVPFDNMSANFPFVCEPDGNWVCKFCQHVPVQFRDPQSQWSSSNKLPPTGQYIEQHLNMCRMYKQSLLEGFQGNIGASLTQPFPFPDPGDTDGTVYEPFPSSFGAGYMGQGTTLARDIQADTPVNRAKSYLDMNDLSATYADGTPVPDHLKLVLHDDHLLLTDYYYYLMKQLRQCQFAETDRRTRGGKRDAIEIGYGGLQCVHCAKLPNARKFFWGSVDRLANSFAEIPTHILKCRGCPEETQDALRTLKEKHADQMAVLPRGSQKVYFRRMWRRIHPILQQQHQPPISLEVTNSPPATSSPPPEKLDPFTTRAAIASSPGGGASASDESVVLERSAMEAAKALADSVFQTSPLSPTSRILLAIPEDKQWLSDIDVFVRQQVEVFCATREDVDDARAQNRFPIEEGTVGIRCIHCALSKRGDTEHSTTYPFSISGLYEAVSEFHHLHLDHCKNAPPRVVSKLASLKGNSSLSSIGRDYYRTAAQCLGLIDTKGGIRASGRSVPFQGRAFSFAEPPPASLTQGTVPAPPSSRTTRERSPSPRQPGDRKRKARPRSDDPIPRAEVGDSATQSQDVLSAGGADEPKIQYEQKHTGELPPE